ncbi:hypothetical protein [Acetobacterium woodii]|uniref:Uncharacterized protein n=1 Tax=Acetobacterium woodii (strain ATCC 29683 / DSM 1030 / JCM 2381 / KCTC 1655 / WB1) TaxID=931626 RepID=H6LGD0_ACEWD|nr:hypothetical protein [Acetobacterium woodii]AFA47066.1 hypothetical protein Awo_c02570 [Acetobacterium woodii DSM 1030]
MSAEKLNHVTENITDDNSVATPFYHSTWWLVIWSLLIWPIGLIMLWSYFSNMHKNEMPRTKLIKDHSKSYETYEQ